MTKKEIIAELAKYDIHATLRPRKSTLLELLERVRKEKRLDMLTSDVLAFDDLRSFEKDPERWYKEHGIEACQVKPHILDSFMAKLVLMLVYAFFIVIGLQVVNFYTLELPPGEFFGLIAMAAIIIGIPLWVIWMEFKRG